MRYDPLAGWRRAYGRWIGLFLFASAPLSADTVLMLGGDQTGWPAEATDIVTVSAGSHHVLAIRENGSVIAWGKGGADGRLNVPSELGPALAVAAGKANGEESHSVAVLQDGTVVCWGGNSQGQSSVPAGLSEVVAVAAGSIHTVALKSDGTVVSWGGPPALNEVMSRWRDIVQIAASAARTTGVKSDGTLIGCSMSGTVVTEFTPEFGNIAAVVHTKDENLMALQTDGTLILPPYYMTPERSNIIPPGPHRIKALGAGQGAFVLKEDHTVENVNWLGRPLHRGIGLTGLAVGKDFMLIQASPISPEISVVGEREIPIFSHGVWREEYIFVEGSQVPFEASARLRFKNGGATSLTLPVISVDSPQFTLDLPPLPLVLPPGGSVDIPVKVPMTTPGTRRGMLRVASSDPRFAEQNVPIFAHGHPPHPRPGTVVAWADSLTPLWSSAEMTDAVAIAAGSLHALVLRADGTVVGRRFDNPTANGATPELRNVVKIAAGHHVSAVVHRDGTMTAWNELPGFRSPVEKTPYGVIDVSTSVVRTHYWQWGPVEVALKVDGTVTSMSSSNFGFSDVPDVEDVVQVETGGPQAVALKNDGTVVGVRHDTAPPAGLSGVVAVAAGGISEHFFFTRLHMLALKSDGSVVGWGNFPPVIPEGLSDVTAIAAGGMEALALKSDGTLVSVRPAYFGDGNPSIPQGLRDVSAIAVGGSFSLAIAPPIPTWHPPFRTWMTGHGYADWTADPDGNGSNHWEDWVFGRDLGNDLPLECLLIEATGARFGSVPRLRMTWRLGALRPLVLLSSDLREWGRISKNVTDETAPSPPDGLQSLQYPLHWDNDFPPGFDFFRVLAP